VSSEQAGQRLDKVLAALLPLVPRTRIFRLIRKGEVRVNGKRIGADYRVAIDDVVRVPPVRIEPPPVADDAPATIRTRVPAKLIEQVESSILHQDERLIVLDKPSGIAVHGGSGVNFGVIEILRASRPDETLELAHRLDRDTSGILMIARKPAALRALHALLRENQVQKKYLVLVLGRWELGHKHIHAQLRTDARVSGERTVRVDAGGKEAHTEFRLVEQFGPQVSLIEATLHTGRTHQIRVHAAYCGHPVAGDEKYGDQAANEILKQAGLRRLFLHAHSCSFEWPGGAEASFSSPLPNDLRSVLDALGVSRGRKSARSSAARAGHTPKRAGSPRGGSRAAPRGRSGRR
jgi:23S rRNA pseudouridine955/2504/2580 synthase